MPATDRAPAAGRGVIARARRLYPLLFAAFPALQLAAANPGEYTARDLLIVLAATVGACAAVYALAALLLRDRASKSVPPLLAAVVVAWFFVYMPVANRLARQAGALGGHLVLLPLGAAATIGALWWLVRRPRQLEGLTSFLALFGVVLVAPSLATIAVNESRAAWAIAHSGLARELAGPTPLRAPAGRPAGEPLPDVYLVVLDMYASSDVLRERYGFENGAFEDTLRTLGFTVPRGVRSNYNQTMLSLASLLNFEHVTRLASDLDTGSADASLPYHLVENNRTVRFLKARGYTFLFFPSPWWTGTVRSPHADREFHAWRGTDPRGQVYRSDLRRRLRGRTPLALLDYRPAMAMHARHTFEGLKEVPRDSAPTFAFAHLLLPHPPYVFDPGCRTLTGPRASTELDSAATRREYFAQLQCTNALVLDLVRTLLDRSAVPPVIILQGDHGSVMLEPALDIRPGGSFDPAQARAQFGAFGAYYLPAGGDGAIPDSTTLVNVVGGVLRAYLGADVAREADSLYYATWQKPFNFVPIDKHRLDAR